MEDNIIIKIFYSYPKKVICRSYRLDTQCGDLFRDLYINSGTYCNKSIFYFHDNRITKRNTLQNRLMLGYNISPYVNLKTIYKKFIRDVKEDNTLCIYQSCSYKYMPIYRIRYAISIFDAKTKFPPCDNFYEEEAINLLKIGEIDKEYFKSGNLSDNNAPENMTIIKYPGGARKAINRKNLLVYLHRIFTENEKNKVEPEFIIDPVTRVNIRTDFARTIYELVKHITEPFFVIDLQD